MSSDLEQELVKAFKYGEGLSKQDLTDLAKEISRLSKKLDVRPVRAFPSGEPNPNGMGIEFSTDKQNLARIVEGLAESDLIKEWTVLKKGMPFPEIYEIKAKAGGYQM